MRNLSFIKTALFASNGAFQIGVGTAGCEPVCPSLRTVRADLPHTALRSVVLPHRGLTKLVMGCGQRYQPMSLKIGIAPAIPIRVAYVAFALALVTKHST